MLVSKLKTTMVTFVIAIPDGVAVHVMKTLTNVLMEHTIVLMVANVSMKKDWFKDFRLIQSLYRGFQIRLFNSEFYTKPCMNQNTLQQITFS